MQKFYKSVIQFFEERIGEGTAWDLDYGKLLIIGLLVYHIFFPGGFVRFAKNKKVSLQPKSLILKDFFLRFDKWKKVWYSIYIINNKERFL